MLIWMLMLMRMFGNLTMLMIFPLLIVFVVAVDGKGKKGGR